MPEPRSFDWVGREADPTVAARLSELYDLSFGDKDDDVGFFRSMAKRTGGPVLELGCGTGRLAIALAADGHRVVGLDSSAAQLALARTKAAAAGVKVELVLGDMRDFALPEPFKLIAIAFNTFLHLDERERRACLARVREHLAGDGLFALDVFQPDPDKISGAQGAVVQEWSRTDPRTGAIVTKTVASTADVDGVSFTVAFDEVDAASTVRRYTTSSRLHYVYRRELELLLPAAGFAVVAMYGDYELDAVTPASPKLLTIARRRERGELEDRRGR